MNHDLLVIGSTCVDVIIRVDHLPQTEENLHPDSQRFAVGGCAYNVANILGRAGAPVTFVTPVGEQGVFGGFAAAQLAKLPFAKPVLLPDAANGCCYCLVEATGERTFMSIHGAEYSFSPDWMKPYANQRFRYGYVCGLEVEEKTGGLLADYMKTAPVETWMYAPGPRGAGIDKARTEAIFALHPILHLSGAEASALSGRDGLDESLIALYERTHAPIVATIGELGARVLLDRDTLATVPGCPSSHVVDTIGAGDAHAGAILLGLSRGMALVDAAALANRVCAKVVETDGATLSEKDFAALGLREDRR